MSNSFFNLATWPGVYAIVLGMLGDELAIFSLRINMKGAVINNEFFSVKVIALRIMGSQN